MIPAAIALIGGAAVAAGAYTRKKFKESGSLRVFAGDLRDVAAEAGDTLRDLSKTELAQAAGEQRRKLGHAMERQFGPAFQEVHVFVVAVVGDAKSTLHDINVDESTALDSADRSYPAFWLPFQDVNSHNHSAQWVEKVQSNPPPGSDAGGCVQAAGLCNANNLCCNGLICCNGVCGDGSGCIPN